MKKIIINVYIIKFTLGIENHSRKLPKQTIIVDNKIIVLESFLFASANIPNIGLNKAIKIPDKAIVHPQREVP